MARKIPRLTVDAYDKKWRFDARKYCGFTKCDRLRKVFPISNDAVPSKENGFLCPCGRFTDEDNWYHVVHYKGKEIKYD